MCCLLECFCEYHSFDLLTRYLSLVDPAHWSVICVEERREEKGPATSTCTKSGSSALEESRSCVTFRAKAVVQPSLGTEMTTITVERGRSPKRNSEAN